MFPSAVKQVFRPVVQAASRAFSNTKSPELISSLLSSKIPPQEENGRATISSVSSGRIAKSTEQALHPENKPMDLSYEQLKDPSWRAYMDALKNRPQPEGHSVWPKGD
jgi:hypothetical protein